MLLGTLEMKTTVTFTYQGEILVAWYCHYDNGPKSILFAEPPTLHKTVTIQRCDYRVVSVNPEERVISLTRTGWSI